MSQFITTAEAARRNGISIKYVAKLCRTGDVPGAQMFGDVWMVPASFKWKPRKPGPKPKAK